MVVVDAGKKNWRAGYNENSASGIRSGLPAITDQVDIDGRSQPGYVNGGDPMIMIDGLYAGPSAEGLNGMSKFVV